MTSFLKPSPEFRNGFKDPKRLAAVRKLECCACEKLGIEQKYPTESHHLIGYGMGKKASDLLTIPLCFLHHAGGNMGDAIHETPLKRWEERFETQQKFLEMTNRMLEHEK